METAVDSLQVDTYRQNTEVAEDQLALGAEVLGVLPQLPCMVKTENSITALENTLLFTPVLPTTAFAPDRQH